MESNFFTKDLVNFLLEVANTETSKRQREEDSHIETPDLSDLSDVEFYVVVLRFIGESAKQINERDVHQIMPSMVSIVHAIAVMVQDYKASNPDWVGGESAADGITGQIKDILG